MNFKDYSLHQHLEHTKDAYYARSENLLLGAEHGSYRYGAKNNTVLYNKDHKRIVEIHESKQYFSIMYKGEHQYTQTWDTETYVGVNVMYSKNTARKKFTKKNSDFYTMYTSKDDVHAYRNNKNGQFKIDLEGNYKLYHIMSNGTHYVEKYTAVSNTLVQSRISNHRFGIIMEKTASGKTGKCNISDIRTGKRYNFTFEGEPCVLRLMNNSVIFEALLNTELALCIEDLRESIKVSIGFLQKTPVPVRNMQEILEYYTNNAT